MNLGARLRELRISNGYSLSELSRRTGLSMSFLSHLERGEVNASLSSLQSVVEALGTSLVDLFSQVAPCTVTVMRKSERFTLREAGAALAMLATETHPVIPCVATLDPGARTNGGPRAHRQGYEFAFVLKGRVDYHIDRQVYSISMGDSLLFDARLDHFCVNSSNEPCSWLWVAINTSVRDAS